MKKIMSFILMLGLLILTSCGGFMVTEDEISIESISSTVLEDGTTLVTIKYTDEELAPLELRIPKGVIGETGRGIQDIEYKNSENGITTDVIIKMSDGTEENIKINNGLSVKTTRYEDDQDGNRYLILIYQDNTESEKIPLQKGETGTNGLSMVEFTQVPITEGEHAGGVKLTFKFSDGTEDNTYTKDIIVPAPQKGETGKGIKAIVSGEDKGKYYLQITYTTDEVEIFEFDKPEIKEWLSENRPPYSTDGKNGDYFFDTLNKIIYVKINENWSKIIELQDDSVNRYVSVTLNLNAPGDTTARFDTGAQTTYFILKGSSILADDYSDTFANSIPLRDGYKFVGWYGVRDTKDNPIHGMFTDVTSVYENIEIYAKWEKIS